MLDNQRVTYIGSCEDLKIFNGQAILNLVISFYYCGDVKFDFPGFTGLYFTVHNERLGRIIKNLTYSVARSDNNVIINVSESDLTFDSNGKYWYELGYVQGGVYETVLRYGKLIVV